MALLGFSGFETGDTSEWTTVTAGISAQTTVVNSNGGGYAATSTTLPSEVSRSITAQATLYVRFYLRLHSLSTSISDVSVFLCSGSGGNISGVGIETDGSGNPSIVLINFVTSSVVSTASAISPDTWHRIEFKTVISATVGILELYVDGILIQTVSSLNTGTNNVTDVACYYTNVGGGSPSGTVYWDDVAYSSTGYPGVGGCLARQFNQTTPHYNAWTKSTGSVWNCWDDTPFNATTNCSISTSAAKQTGVTNFSNTTDTGASGHGPGFLLGFDTINAAKISWVGKTSSSDTNVDSSIFRTPAGASGTDTTTAGVAYTTSDTYQETQLSTTPTTAQILNCEAGLSKSSGTKTHTVEDLWLMVDATLVRPRARGVGYHKPNPTTKVPVHYFRQVTHPHAMLAATSIGMVHTARHFVPRSKLPFKVRKERWQRYAIGMPFVHLAHEARQFVPKPKVPFKVRKERWQRYPIGMPFVHVPHALRRFFPRPKVPFKVRPSRWVRNPRIPYFVGRSQANNNNSGVNVNITTPPFTQSGDMMVLVVVSNGVPPTGPGSGWQFLGTSSTSFPDYTSAYAMESTGTATYTVGGDFPKVILRVYRGVNIVDNSGISGTSTIPALNPTAQNRDVYVGFFINALSNITSGPADLVNGVSDSVQWNSWDGDKIIANKGTTPGAESVSSTGRDMSFGVTLTFAVTLAHGARRFTPRPRIPFKVRKERWQRYPVGLPFVRLAHAARHFIPRPKVPFKVRKERWIRYPVTVVVGRLAHAARQFVPRSKIRFAVRKERWQRYPIGLPFVRLAHAARRFVPRPKLPFKVHKALWLRYPIGIPFVRLAHAARRFVPKPKVPFKVQKERWQRYPIGLPFVRLAHAARRFVPRPKVPFSVRKERWLRYPIGMPFVRLAHAARRFVPRPKLPFKVRKALWLRYPIGMPFVRLAHATRHFVPRPKFPFKVHKALWIRYPITTQFVRLAHAVHHFIPRPKPPFQIRKVHLDRIPLPVTTIFIDHAYASGGGFGSPSINISTWSLQANDLLVAFYVCSASVDPGVPTGFTDVGYTYNEINICIGLSYALWTSQTTITWPAQVNAEGILYVFRGPTTIDSFTMPLGHGGTSGGTTANLSVPGATQTVNEPLVCAWAANSTANGPGNFTTSFGTGAPTGPITDGYRILASAGTTPPTENGNASFYWAGVGATFTSAVYKTTQRHYYKPRPKIPFKVRKEYWVRYPIGLPFVRLAHAARRFVPKPRLPFHVRKALWLRYPIGMPFVRLAHAARKFVPRPRTPFRVRKERWIRNPSGFPFIRLAHAARRFVPQPKVPFKVHKARWIRNFVTPVFVHLAHTVHRFVPRPKVPFRVHKERWIRNPSGFPFIHLAHAARRFVPRPKVPFKVRKERWQRYAIGMPFVHIARAGRHFIAKPQLPFRVHKARWIRYPIAAQFVRLVHAARHFTPRPKTPFKVRKERWLRYPIGLPFARLAHAARHAIRDPKLPSWVRKARWVRYPIGLPFVHVARAGRRFIARPKIRFAVRKERWVRYSTGLPFVRLAHAVRHFVQSKPTTRRISRTARKIRALTTIPLAFFRREIQRRKPYPWQRPFRWRRQWRDIGIRIPAADAPRIIFPATLNQSIVFEATLDQTIIFPATLDQTIIFPARLT